MSVDEFGLGGWWPRPAQAAVGALDHLPVGQWPELAAKWLAAGYDSQPLRQLAKLPAGDTRAMRQDVLDLMPKAMRSIGFDPAPADVEFQTRCQQALDIVQHDLDVTGYGQYRMQARPVRPGVMYAAFPDGSYWGGGEGMSRQMEGSWLLFNAAESVSATIEEWHEIEWPVCAAHSHDPRISWDPVALIKKAAWWQCTRAHHVLAPVGQLTAQFARTL